MRLTAHVTDNPDGTASVLHEEHARGNQRSSPLTLGEALEHGPLALVVLVLPGERIVDLGHVAINVVFIIVQPHKILPSLFNLTARNEKVRALGEPREKGETDSGKTPLSGEEDLV